MKARVKATGEVIEISEECSCVYAEHYDKSYNLNELELLDVKEKSLPKDEPDYWKKLEHQYAGMVMQGLLMNPKLCEIETSISIARIATTITSALINKLKEESQCEK